MNSRARAMPQQRQGGSGLGLILLVLVAGLGLAYIAPLFAALEQLERREHADARHGEAAVTHILAHETHAEIRDRFKCPDGRLRTAVFLPDGKVAMTVRNSTGQLITAFMTDTKYLSRELSRCRSEADQFPFFVPLEERQHHE